MTTGWVEPHAVRQPQFGIGAAAAISTGVYFVGAVLGVVGALSIPMGALTASDNSLTVSSLFWHNLGVLAWLALGAVTGGVATVAVLGLNGMILGWVVETIIANGQGRSFVTGVLPHLPFELFAYIASAAATLPVAVDVVRRLRRRRPSDPGIDWTRWLAVHAAAVVLLFLAAVVEAGVSHV